MRRIALEIGLPNAKKKDSTGICFIGERPFREFRQRYLRPTPGPMLDEQGHMRGRHVGLSFYTLSQRQGLGIGGVKHDDSGEVGHHAPWFVADKDIATNLLRVVQGHDHPALLFRSLQAVDCSWVSGVAPEPGRLGAKARHHQADATCELQPGGDGFALILDAAKWAVTPGQSAVLYDGEVCLGGGVSASADAPQASTVAAPAASPTRARCRGPARRPVLSR